MILESILLTQFKKMNYIVDNISLMYIKLRTHKLFLFIFYITFPGRTFFFFFAPFPYFMLQTELKSPGDFFYQMPNDDCA